MTPPFFSSSFPEGFFSSFYLKCCLLYSLLIFSTPKLTPVYLYLIRLFGYDTFSLRVLRVVTASHHKDCFLLLHCLQAVCPPRGAETRLGDCGSHMGTATSPLLHNLHPAGAGVLRSGFLFIPFLSSFPDELLIMSVKLY